MKTPPLPSVAVSALILSLLSACDPGVEDTSAPPEISASAASMAASALQLTEVPAEVPGLQETLAAAAIGESVLFTGRVGGVHDPLSPDFALFVIADEALVFCDEEGLDTQCASPWDACCEDPAKVTASRAVVQFVDDAGEPLLLNLAETLGLAANDTVVVRGRLHPAAADGNRVILAEGIAVRDRSGGPAER